jgi:hypothetical protein
VQKPALKGNNSNTVGDHRRSDQQH